MDSGEKAAIGVAGAVVLAAVGYELWKMFGKTKSLNVSAGGTYSVALSANGGKLNVTAPAGAVPVLAIATSPGTTTTATYQVNGAANADTLTMGMNTLTITWVGGVAIVNINVS